MIYDVSSINMMETKWEGLKKSLKRCDSGEPFEKPSPEEMKSVR